MIQIFVVFGASIGLAVAARYVRQRWPGWFSKLLHQAAEANYWLLCVLAIGLATVASEYPGMEKTYAHMLGIATGASILVWLAFGTVRLLIME